MTRSQRLIGAALFFAVGMPAAAAETDKAAVPETRTCLDNRSIRTKDVSAQHGYFVRTPQGWWHNTGPSCSAFGPNRILMTQSNQNAQCRGDLVRVVDQFSNIEFGACVLGDWERVDAPPKD